MNGSSCFCEAIISIDSYFDYGCKKYYPQIVDSTIFEALVEFN